MTSPATVKLLTATSSAVLIFWIVPAAAELDSISLPNRAAIPTGFAAFETGTSVMSFPRTPSGVTIQFVLPQRYRRNGRVQIIFAMSGTAGCTMHFVPAELRRIRAGQLVLNNLTGLTAEDGSATVHFPETGDLVHKVFVLRANAVFPDQRRGDAIQASFARDNPADNCSTVSLFSIDVRYPLR